MTVNRLMSSEYMEWAKCHSSARYNLAGSGLSDYPPESFPSRFEEIKLSSKGSYGHEELLQAIAARYGGRTENVFSTLGTSMANHLVMARILDRDDEVVIERPTYELLLSTSRYFGVTIKRFERRLEHGFKIDVDELKRVVSDKTRLIVITNLHNPSSAYADQRTMREIGIIAQQVGACVLVDEVYLDSALGASAQSAFHLGSEFVITNSLTKVYGLSGLRCGWILAEPALVKKLWRLNDLFYVNAPFPTEQMSVLAFAHFDEIAGRAHRLLKTNHDLLDRFLDSRNDLDVFRPEFGTTVFPKLVRGNVERLCKLLRAKYDTSVVPGSYFEMPEHFRIGFGCETKMLSSGLEQLSLALDEIASEV